MQTLDILITFLALAEKFQDISRNAHYTYIVYILIEVHRIYTFCNLPFETVLCSRVCWKLYASSSR